MRVLVTGASGLIGSALVPALALAGHQVVRAVRRAARDPDEVEWNPETGSLRLPARPRIEAAVHLAGEGIAAGRWTRARKAAIRDSRVVATRLLCEALGRLSPPPRVLVAASAIGYYGDRAGERLVEESPPGGGFLADLCREWEAASAVAEQRGIRVVRPRIGLVLSVRGGALARLLPIFRLGLGGVIADGKAWWSWIAIPDLVEVLCFAVARDGVRGALNAVAPAPVTNADFTRALGRALSRPAPFRVPAFALRLRFGELADQGLLSSARVEPRGLLRAGYGFRFPELEPALRHLLATRQ